MISEKSIERKKNSVSEFAKHKEINSEKFERESSAREEKNFVSFIKVKKQSNE